MKTIEYRTMDKTAWGDGPWQDEPDKVQFEVLGVPALIKRGPSGVLCGYVGVTEGHPWFEKFYGDIRPYPDVHGGLTFSDFCHDGPEAETICHIPDAGEPDRVWWLGFDCGHLDDLVPMLRAVRRDVLEYPPDLIADFEERDTYRDIEYVRGQITHLASQVLAVVPKLGADHG